VAFGEIITSNNNRQCRLRLLKCVYNSAVPSDRANVPFGLYLTKEVVLHYAYFARSARFLQRVDGREGNRTAELPVYNAERYLSAAIDSLLSQTFTDFELLIADNASTDSTQRICREYAARDARVRYFRHQENMGAGWNHNYLLNLARSEFFKWAAGDDLCAPTFLERCIDALDNPDAVLSHPLTRIIGENGASPGDSEDVEPDAMSPQVTRRFRDLAVEYHRCYAIFGVMRRNILALTGGQPNCVHGDAILLAHLALYGPFHAVPEYQF
jgi:hypothetical protein